MPSEPKAKSKNKQQQPKVSVACATWITGDTLVLIGTFGSGRAARTLAFRLKSGRYVRAAGSILPGEATGGPGLLIVPLPEDAVTTDVTAIRIGADIEIELADVLADVAQLLRSGLSTASIQRRAAALDFLIRTTAGNRATMPADLSAALVLARQILRERLPSAVVDRAAKPSAQVDVLVQVDPQTLYVRGWVGYMPSELIRLTLISPEGESAEIPPTAFRHPRTDVADFYEFASTRSVDLGFASICEISAPSARTEGWLLEVETLDGTFIETTCPQAIDRPMEVRNQLIAEIALERPPSQALRVHHLLPAIARVQEQLNQSIRISRVEQFGLTPVDPDVSIVVPLYKRIDFLEHQLAQFVHDPQIAQTDLIYVLDSPEQERQLLAEAERISRLYRIPFRVVVLSSNGGFSMANNLGVSLAQGRLVLLMNSDVLPDRPGWLGDLVEFHDSLPDPGAVGPKLVYEDESLQHAGMYFDRPLGARLWFNEHYFKGLHRSFAPACESRPVPAISAACLLIRTALYREINGLRGMFIQGDFEDSDLCLRLHERGHENWYAADVTLYHLEGQSYPSPMRHANGEFNRWLHTHLWDSRIEAIMAREKAEISV